MRPDLAQWEQTRRYDYLDDLPMNGLAWECLRRNRGYQEDFRKLVEADADERHGRLREHWGLQFRGTSEPIRVRRAGALVCEGRHCHRSPHLAAEMPV